MLRGFLRAPRGERHTEGSAASNGPELAVIDGRTTSARKCAETEGRLSGWGFGCVLIGGHPSAGEAIDPTRPIPSYLLSWSMCRRH